AMQHRNHKILIAIAMVAGLILAACGGGTSTLATGGGATTEPGGADSGGEGVTIRYQVWDANQQPAYQACADEFHKQNPNITVKIEQLGWSDSWSGLQ